MTTSALVLGAGFGGLELSARLSKELGDQVDVTLIDRADSFVFGLAEDVARVASHLPGPASSRRRPTDLGPLRRLSQHVRDPREYLG